MSSTLRHVTHSIAFVTLFILLATTLPVFAQEDAASVHKKLADQFSTAQSLRLVASSSALNNTKLTISAKRKDKYLLELNDRRIYCDGSTIWNYTPSKKSVVISTYNPQGTSLSVEKLLLELIAAYKPTSLKNQNNSASGSSYLLSLEPNGAPRYGVLSMQLSVDKKNLALKSIGVKTDQGTQLWTISAIQRNVDLKDSAFSFKIPKGVEVIDLRN